MAAKGAALMLPFANTRAIWILWGLFLGSIYTFKPAHDE